MDRMRKCCNNSNWTELA